MKIVQIVSVVVCISDVIDSTHLNNPLAGLFTSPNLAFRSAPASTMLRRLCPYTPFRFSLRCRGTVRVRIGVPSGRVRTLDRVRGLARGVASGSRRSVRRGRETSFGTSFELVLDDIGECAREEDERSRLMSMADSRVVLRRGDARGDETGDIRADSGCRY